ncbi:CMTR2 [Branchiostoma lanceolatum]|uniref:Cap-specific mRNA (nucleoside-2'-O-)-methyltransferase 2 n=1 Tax=Branchiostoma lanceolatum TaxID=7740 RepID=A0A8K0F352_BRALA|nr:CMTR2 [Branchiostoma lanceolatum]
MWEERDGSIFQYLDTETEMSHKRPHPSPRQPYPKQHGGQPHPQRQHFTQDVWDETERLFSKTFSFVKPTDDPWHLPPAEVFFTNQNEPFPELSEMKEELNRVKGLLSDKEIRSWHEHTNQTNRAGKVISHLKQTIHPQLCTQAWCKFHEIVSTFPLVSEAAVESGLFNSVHVCEAPGAFITSLNHYLANWRVDCDWNWVGNSLNPYYEGNDLEHTIDDDRFIFGTLSNWHFGADNTGDIMSEENLKHLKEFVADIQPVHLVTADGSIDCQKNPGEQESIVSQLHYCEVVTADGSIDCQKNPGEQESIVSQLHYCEVVTADGSIDCQKNPGEQESIVSQLHYCEVTADGSIDCQKNPGEQESLVSQLHYCEVVSALQLLGEGGALVVKKFTMLEPSSACLMFLLNCVFAEVHAFKPATSKSGNSEVYVVCVGYSGQEALAGHMDTLMSNFKPASHENDLFPCDALPATFTSQLVSCCRQFTELQCETIRENLRLFEAMSEAEAEHIRQARKCCAQEYVHRYQLRPIRKDHRIYTEAPGRSNFTSDLRKKLQGSFNERQQQALLPWAQKIVQEEGGGQGSLAPERTAIATIEETEPSPDAVEDVVYPVVGRAVGRVWNSRFCDVHVLGQWNEALDKAQILLLENRDFLRKLQEDMGSSEDEAFLVLKGQQLSQSLLPKVLCLTNTCVLKLLKPYLSAGLEPKMFSVDCDPVETFLALREVNPDGDVLPASPGDRTGVLQDSRTGVLQDSRTGVLQDSRCAAGLQVRAHSGVSNVLPASPGDRTGVLQDSRTGVLQDSRTGVLQDSRTGVLQDSRTGVLQDSRLPKLLQMTGVDMIVADLRTDTGEFGQEENNTKEEFVLLCLLALKSLPPGGVLVCCIHTVLTRFTAGLVYILHRVFNKCLFMVADSFPVVVQTVPDCTQVSK